MVKPAVVNPCVPSQWTLGDHWSNCPASALFARRLNSQSICVHKQNNQTNKSTVWKSVALERVVSGILSAVLDLELPILFDLWNSCFFVFLYQLATIVWCQVGAHSSKTTYLNPSVHHWNAKICASKYTVHFSPLYLGDILPKQLGLPFSFRQCVYFYLLQMSGELKYND